MLTIDDEQVIVTDSDGSQRVLPLGSPEAFALLSRLWLRSGWELKYSYSFTWLGRPVIQLPEDLLRLQEAIYTLRPVVIVETGIAHGGLLVFSASLCRLLGHGRVIGIDFDIRPHNRRAIEAHPLTDLITLVEGDSVSPAVIRQVRALVPPGANALVLLDSRHTRDHVLAELQAYAPFIRPGSYLVAMDGIMEDLSAAPRGRPDWTWNNPRQAALEFVRTHPDFAIEEPGFLFNEGQVRERVTYWPSAFVKRLRE
jgi:cephalosporin hydroxylase